MWLGRVELVPFAVAALEARTPGPVMALSVFGVIVAPPDTDELIMLRKAAALGDGGGDDTGPPMRGVRPERGIRPVRKLDGSNASVPSWTVVDLQAWREIGAQSLKSWLWRTKRNPIGTGRKERQ
jgi:hypothetical protein